jgi:hypothetical protein
MLSPLFWTRFWHYGAIAFVIAVVVGVVFGATSTVRPFLIVILMGVFVSLWPTVFRFLPLKYTTKVLLTWAALPLLLFALFLRVMAISMWPHPDQDLCSFGSVSHEQYLGYVEKARTRMGEIRAEWKKTPLKEDQFHFPAMVINDVVGTTQSSDEILAATHAAMRAFGGTLVEQTWGGPGYSNLRYRIVVPWAFGGGCLINCYQIQSAAIVPPERENIPIKRQYRIASGMISPNWIFGDSDEIVALFNSPLRCPQLRIP